MRGKRHPWDVMGEGTERLMPMRGKEGMVDLHVCILDRAEFDELDEFCVLRLS